MAERTPSSVPRTVNCPHKPAGTYMECLDTAVVALALTKAWSTLHITIEPPHCISGWGRGRNGSWFLEPSCTLHSTLNQPFVSRFYSASPRQTIDTGHYQRLGYGLNNPDFCSQKRQENVLRLQKHLNGSGAHPASHLVDNWGSFADRNVAGASRSPVTCT